MTAADLLASRLTNSQMESLLAGDLVDSMRDVELVRDAVAARDIGGSTVITLTTWSASPVSALDGMRTYADLAIDRAGVAFGEDGEPPVPEPADMDELTAVAELYRSKLLEIGCGSAAIRVGLDRILVDFEVDAVPGILTITVDD